MSSESLQKQLDQIAEDIEEISEWYRSQSERASSE